MIVNKPPKPIDQFSPLRDYLENNELSTHKGRFIFRPAMHSSPLIDYCALGYKVNIDDKWYGDYRFANEAYIHSNLQKYSDRLIQLAQKIISEKKYLLDSWPVDFGPEEEKYEWINEDKMSNKNDQ